MVSGSEGESLKNKIDPHAVCVRRAKTNSVLCTKYGTGLMADVKITIRLTMCFVCSRCKVNGGFDEEVVNEVETLNRFCFVGDHQNTSGCCKAAVIAKVRIYLVRCRECRVLLLGYRFLLKVKGKFIAFP